MRTSGCDSSTGNETTSNDTPQRRDKRWRGAKPDLTATPPTTANLTPAPRAGEQDVKAQSLDTPGVQTDSSALASLDINLEGDDPYNLSSCSLSDIDGPSSFPGSSSPHPKKRRKRNRLRRLLSPDNVQFLYEDVADMNGGTSSRGHSAEYPQTAYRQKPPLDVPLIASRERNITQEGSSPSTILPGNALQLHLADEGSDGVCGSTPTGTSFSSSCSSNNPPTTIINHPPLPAISLDDDQTPAVAARHPIPRVHFRSRVRITSGLHSGGRSRNLDGARGNSTVENGIDTANSSASGSPSSSISAPLRYQADENNVLGPLGKRINSLAQTRNKRKRQLRRGANSDSSVSERTPFLRASECGPVPDYTRQRRERSRIGSGDEDEDCASRLKREEEMIFGRWPWRLFNRHWIAYQCEPVFCCCSDDRFDDDA
ncbi:hypothetical protein BJ322DRAFT_751368 [Thelephora terrestris]|uniref:Uncharacterized protein n=1 Tax=Thelephora terrestris TaxID=56493 RepID=A0A9P6L7R5_9AGAM|nr:hypothetical protein BJ322DRAFT_751368 [Thelephora terrestris]